MFHLLIFLLRLALKREKSSTKNLRSAPVLETGSLPRNKLKANLSNELLNT